MRMASTRVPPLLHLKSPVVPQQEQSKRSSVLPHQEQENNQGCHNLSTNGISPLAAPLVVRSASPAAAAAPSR